MTSIDIHEPIFDLCHRLGLVPENVAELVFTPTDVRAKVYVLSDDGHKFVRAGEDGKQEAAFEYSSFKVTT